MSDIIFTTIDPDIRKRTEQAFALLSLEEDILGAQRTELYGLIRQGVDTAARSMGTTLLMRCAYIGDRPGVEMLLAEGADLHTGMGRNVALIKAIIGHQAKMVDMLLAADALAGPVGPDYYSPLVASIGHGATKVTPRILRAGVSIHTTNGGATAQEIASPENWQVLEEHRVTWTSRLEKLRAGTYTPASREDWLCLASVLPLEDPVHPPPVEARLQMLHDMRPDISLSGMREKSMRVHTQGAGL